MKRIYKIYTSNYNNTFLNLLVCDYKTVEIINQAVER